MGVPWFYSFLIDHLDDGTVQVMWPERWKVKLMWVKFMICKCSWGVRSCNPLEPSFVLFCVFCQKKRGWVEFCVPYRCQISLNSNMYASASALVGVHLIWAGCWLIHPLKRCVLLLWIIQRLETICEMSSTTACNYSWTKTLWVETNCGACWEAHDSNSNNLTV